MTAEESAARLDTLKDERKALRAEVIQLTQQIEQLQLEKAADDSAAPAELSE